MVPAERRQVAGGARDPMGIRDPELDLPGGTGGVDIVGRQAAPIGGFGQASGEWVTKSGRASINGDILALSANTGRDTTTTPS